MKILKKITIICVIAIIVLLMNNIINQNYFNKQVIYRDTLHNKNRIEDNSSSISTLLAEDISSSISTLLTEDNSSSISNLLTEDNSSSISTLLTEDNSSSKSNLLTEDNTSSISNTLTEDNSSSISNTLTEDNSSSISNLLTEDNSSSISNLLTYESDNDDLSILFLEGKNKLEINFGYGGINSLYGIQGISYLDEEITQPNDNNLNTFKSSTDWIGPYIMKDLSKANNNISEKFTGGWHGSNGDGTGKATATTKSVKIYTDDKLICTKDKKWSKAIKIIVTNLINAYNSTDPVLEEKVTYIIKDKIIYVNVKGTALKNISINRYYGLQSQNKLWNGYIQYQYIDNTVQKFNIYQTSNSMHKKDNTVYEYELSSKNNKYKLFVGLDTNFGLGNFQYLDDSLPTCFTANYGKSYFNLINGNTLNMNKSDIFSWQGYYKFYIQK